MRLVATRLKIAELISGAVLMKSKKKPVKMEN